MNKKYLNMVKTAAAMIALSILWAGAAWGADTIIKSVSVKVESSVEADAGHGTVSASASSSKYHVVSSSLVNDKSSWKAGEVPRAEITIEAEEGYYFTRLNASKVSVRGAEYSSCRNQDDNRIAVITVKLDPVKGILEDVEDAYWEDGPLGKAKWGKVEGAPAYEVKLYRGNTLVHHVKKTTTTNYDFYGYMTVKGDYYFKVRAIPKLNSQEEYLEEGGWTESGIQEVTLRDATAAGDRKPAETAGQPVNSYPTSRASGWEQDGNGWWYKNADGSHPTNCWQMIDGKWYLFGLDGYMLTGWQRWNGKEFYLTSNGDMVTGWFQDKRQWYYLDENKGKISGGWLTVGDQWYYMNYDGTMATGWISSGGNWYYLDPSGGQMVKDRMVGQYYINPDGVYVP